MIQTYNLRMGEERVVGGVLVEDFEEPKQPSWYCWQEQSGHTCWTQNCPITANQIFMGHPTTSLAGSPSTWVDITDSIMPNESTLQNITENGFQVAGPMFVYYTFSRSPEYDVYD